jgi:3-isopropylmalate/(R)-2-methylmalate dehydratase small subunit
MEKFIKLNAIAAPMPIVNIDTDMIIPKQFLKTIKRTGLAEGLFYEMRFDLQGKKIDNFVLNQPKYSNAQIVIAGDNFGCGSSREHAPWALLDFGIRAIIAPSFADIFYNNCFKNGVLPIVLPQASVDALMKVAESGSPEITIDLESQKVSANDGALSYSFDIEPFRKHCMLNGLDDIGLTLQKSTNIDSFEQGDKPSRPWLYAS